MSDDKASQSEDSATGPGPAAAGNGKRPADDRPLPDDPPGAAQNPPSDAPEATPLEVMPGKAPTTPGETGQALVIVPPAGAPQPPPPAPTPIDYAMPSQPKSWLPSPALVKNLGCIFKMLFGFTFLLGVGYFMLMAMNPKARQWALQGSQPGSGGAAGGGSGIGGGRGPTPFKAVNQILALPAQALGKTDDVVKANNARVGLLNTAIAQEEGMAAKGTGGGASRTVINPFVSAPAAAGGGTAAPGTPAAAGGSAELSPDEQRAAAAARMLALQEKLSSMPADGSGGATASGPADRVTATAVKDPEVLAPVSLAGGIVIAGASPAGAPPPTRGFFYWVVRLNLTGVFQNDPPRILLNGRLAYEGQEVNIPLGIVFERLDPARKLLYFRDKTGAVVTRSY